MLPLLLLLPQLINGQGCCPKKLVGADEYMYSNSNPGEVEGFGCFDSCVYLKNGQPGDRYCFGPGDLDVVCDADSPTEPSDDRYCEIGSDHTMCKYPGPSDECTAKMKFRELSDAARTAILDKHNELRSRVALGQEPNQPGAANMIKLVWDQELENIAQRLADQCIFQHDSNRVKLDGTSVGQNVFIMGSSVQASEAEIQASAGDSVQAWYEEVTDPGFNPTNINPYSFSSGTGHYTQVVWADTSSVGCGSVYFEDGFYKNLIVCNYAKAGNFIGSSMYAEGTACSQCPSGSTCTDGLCVL